MHFLSFSLCSSIYIWLFSSLEETRGFEITLVLCSKIHAQCAPLISVNRVQREVVARLFCVFNVNKSLAKKLIVFPTVFLSSCNKQQHIGVIPGGRINDVLVTQSMTHGPAALASPGRVCFLSLRQAASPPPPLTCRIRICIFPRPHRIRVHSPV